MDAGYVVKAAQVERQVVANDTVDSMAALRWGLRFLTTYKKGGDQF